MILQDSSSIMKVIRKTMKLYKYQTVSGPHHRALQPACFKGLIILPRKDNSNVHVVTKI